MFGCNTCVIANKAEGEEYEIYWANEQKCRRYIKRFFYYMACHVQMFAFPALYSIFEICTGNLVPSNWPLPLNIWTPFDSTVVWGWYLIWFIQINMSISYLVSIISCSSYFMTCCFYIIAACDNLNQMTCSINENIKIYKMEKLSTKRQTIYQEIEKKFNRMLEYHAKIYE